MTDSYASLIPEASLTPSQQGSQDGQESHNDPHQEAHPLQMSSDGESKRDPPNEGLQCRMFGYGHMSFPFTNQKDRIGENLQVLFKGFGSFRIYWCCSDFSFS